MDNVELLREQAEKIRLSGLLGQSRLIRLFDFLVESSASDTVPKETVVAAEVFDKSSGFNTLDSSVRVYIHNLRRKLQQFYDGPGKDENVRLALPKGEYRLIVEPRDQPPASPVPKPESQPAPRRRIGYAGWIGGLAVLACVAIGFGSLYRPRNAWESVRSSPVWARVLQNDKPIVIALGDYYIFGDTEQSSDVQRLIREFSVNSKDDLEQYLEMNPKLATRYMDVGLGYLPTSSAFALANIMPILGSGEKRRARVAMMSSLDPAILKSANVVYVGLLSGLGSLQKLVFASSRFEMGQSFDELIDGKTQRHYFSTANPYAGDIRRFGPNFGYHDYGFFSTFAGLGGNQIVIIAGMQDEGLRQLTEVLTDRSRLDELFKQAGGKADFEALFDVLGMDNRDLSGKLVVASPLDPSTIWRAH